MHGCGSLEPWPNPRSPAIAACTHVLTPAPWPSQATPPGAATGSWALLQAFSPALWLALLGTALGAGLLAFLVEVATQNLHADAESGGALVWHALGRFTQARDMVAFSNSASILVLAFSFLCYILW